MAQKGRAKAIVIDEKDNVATALSEIEADAHLLIEHHGRAEQITIRSSVPPGHKFALCEIAPGEYIVKYGEPIGRAAVRISPGEHVHVHNIKSGAKRAEGEP